MMECHYSDSYSRLGYGYYDPHPDRNKWYQSRPILGRASAAMDPNFETQQELIESIYEKVTEGLDSILQQIKIESQEMKSAMIMQGEKLKLLAENMKLLKEEYNEADDEDDSSGEDDSAGRDLISEEQKVFDKMPDPKLRNAASIKLSEMIVVVNNRGEDKQFAAKEAFTAVFVKMKGQGYLGSTVGSEEPIHIVVVSDFEKISPNFGEENILLFDPGGSFAASSSEFDNLMHEPEDKNRGIGVLFDTIVVSNCDSPINRVTIFSGHKLFDEMSQPQLKKKCQNDKGKTGIKYLQSPQGLQKEVAKMVDKHRLYAMNRRNKFEEHCLAIKGGCERPFNILIHIISSPEWSIMCYFMVNTMTCVMGCGMVIAVDILRQLGLITFDFSNPSMQFHSSGKVVALQEIGQEVFVSMFVVRTTLFGCWAVIGRTVRVYLHVSDEHYGPATFLCNLVKRVGKVTNKQRTMEKYAAVNCMVVVVASAANTNTLILKEFAPTICEKNIPCLTGLDHNRALGHILEELSVQVSDVKNVIIWGNHSSTQYSNVNHATVKPLAVEKPACEPVANGACLGLPANAMNDENSRARDTFDWILSHIMATLANLFRIVRNRNGAYLASYIIDKACRIIPTPPGHGFTRENHQCEWHLFSLDMNEQAVKMGHDFKDTKIWIELFVELGNVDYEVKLNKWKLLDGELTNFSSMEELYQKIMGWLKWEIIAEKVDEVKILGCMDLKKSLAELIAANILKMRPCVLAVLVENGLENKWILHPTPPRPSPEPPPQICHGAQSNCSVGESVSCGFKSSRLQTAASVLGSRLFEGEGNVRIQIYRR